MDTGLIVIRQNGLGTYFRVRVDGKHVGTLGPGIGAELRLQVTADLHVVESAVFGGFRRRINVQVAPNENVQLIITNPSRVSTKPLRIERVGGADVGLSNQSIEPPHAATKRINPQPATKRVSPQPTTKRVSPQPATEPVVPQPMATRVVELGRRTTILGTEGRTIDNRQGLSPIVRVIRVIREWTETYAVDHERMTTLHGSAGINILSLKLGGDIDRAVKDHYSVSSGQRHKFEEEVTVTAAPGTRTEVEFIWKDIRQYGEVELTVGGETAGHVPFEVVVGVTFDQRQVDQRAAPNS